MIHGIDPRDGRGEDTPIRAQKNRLHKACQEFESIMNSYLLKSMRQTVMKAGDSEPGREMYEGMMDDALSGEMSKSGGRGLSELLFQQLEPLVEARAKSPGGIQAARPESTGENQSRIRLF